MRQVDLIVVTGSQNNVKAAYTSGTPAIGVGSGNVPSIIDASADLADAAAKVMASKTFDNAVVGACGLKRESLAGAKFLMVSETGWGKDFPFSDEKLSPVLTVYRARDFEHACEITSGVLKYKGQGHSVSIHSKDDAHIDSLGHNLPVPADEPTVAEIFGDYWQSQGIEQQGA